MNIRDKEYASSSQQWMKNDGCMPSRPPAVLAFSFLMVRHTSGAENTMRLSLFVGGTNLAAFGKQLLSIEKFLKNVCYRMDAFFVGSVVREPSFLYKAPTLDAEQNFFFHVSQEFTSVTTVHQMAFTAQTMRIDG
jgi:hypothetical protein